MSFIWPPFILVTVCGLLSISNFHHFKETLSTFPKFEKSDLLETFNLPLRRHTDIELSPQLESQSSSKCL